MVSDGARLSQPQRVACNGRVEQSGAAERSGIAAAGFYHSRAPINGHRRRPSRYLAKSNRPENLYLESTYFSMT